MKKKKRGLSAATLFPLLVGILATPLALRAAGILALSGPGAMTLLYPWVETIKSPVLKISADISIPVAQWVMYLQFPFYGLVMTWMMRKRRFITALVTAAFLHGIGIGLTYLLDYLQNPTLKFL